MLNFSLRISFRGVWGTPKAVKVDGDFGLGACEATATDMDATRRRVGDARSGLAPIKGDASVLGQSGNSLRASSFFELGRKRVPESSSFTKLYGKPVLSSANIRSPARERGNSLGSLAPLDSPASMVSMMSSMTMKSTHDLRSLPRPVSGKDASRMRKSRSVKTLAPLRRKGKKSSSGSDKKSAKGRRKSRKNKIKAEMEASRPLSAPVEVSGFTQRYRKLCNVLHCREASAELTAFPVEDFLLAVLEVMVWNRGYELEGNRKLKWMKNVTGYSNALARRATGILPIYSRISMNPRSRAIWLV